MAVAVDHHHVARPDHVVPDDLVRRRRAVGDEEEVIAAEDARGVALARRHRPGVVEQLPQFLDGVAHVGAQQVLAEELVEHVAHRALQERDPAGVPRAVPGVRPVLRVVGERAEERRREAVEVGARLAHDVARDELGRVLEHVDEAVQLAQHVVRDVPGGARLAVEEDRDVRVPPADLLHERAQPQHRVLAGGGVGEFFVVDRQDERGSAALLLREAGEVAVAGDAEHLDALALDRARESADSEPARVLRAEILVDDDDREAESHGRRRGAGREGGSLAVIGARDERSPRRHGEHGGPRRKARGVFPNSGHLGPGRFRRPRRSQSQLCGPLCPPCLRGEALSPTSAAASRPSVPGPADRAPRQNPIGALPNRPPRTATCAEE